ncbi:MAG: mechanosensitive ion channel [Actinophytocola sp.]|nr:mechanosensitive ion channel [Actinophytocola sp.]
MLPLPSAPECASDEGTWCGQVYRLTGNEWLAASAHWLVAKPLKILLILVIAFLVRYLIRKLIDKLTKAPGDGKLPPLLRPLRNRANNKLNNDVIERNRQRAETIGSVLKSVTTFLVLGIAVIEILAEVGINVGPLLASAGIVGVALGFGAQNLVRDFLSGIFMMLEDQYGVGDFIDVGEAIGEVEAVGLRITTLRALDGTVWYVRNGEILRVGNSSQDHSVAVVDIPLAHGTDIEHATRLIAQVATEVASEPPVSEDTLERPEVLGVDNVTVQAIYLRLILKVRPGKQWMVQRLLRAKILAALSDAGFENPLPLLLGGGDTRK